MKTIFISIDIIESFSNETNPFAMPRVSLINPNMLAFILIVEAPQ
jgi:hypothetical protein